ncbi:MAG TPA: hypothetical protein PKY82_16405 [Pyrinomonadaceae bacterium]|nr:hypothetical protein [Pyrinomonadaceae bacterium]
MFKTIIFKSLILMSFMTFNSFSNFAQNKTNDCRPEVDMGSLLNNISVNGGLFIGKLYATCLPIPVKKSQTTYEYHPYDGGKLSSVLKSADGQTINTFVWYGEQITGLWELSRYEIVGGANSLKKLNNGKYTLEFALEDKVFQTFPFSVSTAESKDQFNPKTVYLLDGLWQTYATLYAPKIDRFFQLTVWLRDPKNLGEFKPDPVQYSVKLIREKDKQILAEGKEKIVLDYNWQSYPVHFRRPNFEQTKDYSEVKLSEVTATDGNYIIEFALNGKSYSSYKLTVKNGRLNDFDLPQMQKEKYKIIIPLNSGS